MPCRVLLPPPLQSLRCGLPSPEWPSDHVSILVEFALLPATEASSEQEVNALPMSPRLTPAEYAAMQPQVGYPDCDVGDLL